MAHLNLADFNEFPAECLTALGNYLLKRTTLTTREIAEHGLTILAYGLNLGLPTDGGLIVAGATPTTDDDKGQALLSAGAANAVPVAAIPWPIIIPIVLEILRRLIK